MSRNVKPVKLRLPWNVTSVELCLPWNVEPVKPRPSAVEHPASQTVSPVDELISRSSDNRMNVNTRKTKEIVLGPLACNLPNQLNIGNQTVDKVAQYKVLGVTVSQSLKWNKHVVNICSKLNKQLYFVKQLPVQVCDKTSRGVCMSCMALKSDCWTEQSNRVRCVPIKQTKYIKRADKDLSVDVLPLFTAADALL